MDVNAGTKAVSSADNALNKQESPRAEDAQATALPVIGLIIFQHGQLLTHLCVGLTNLRQYFSRLFGGLFS